jgi:hypothetical protein
MNLEEQPAIMNSSPNPESSTYNSRPSKGKLSTAEARREYQRRYYQMNKEKAKEYQRLYNLTHKKKKGGRGKANFVCPREAARMTYNTLDIMHTPAQKLANDHKTGVLDKICSGDRLFTR